MKYSKELLKTHLQYNKLTRGKLRMLGRLVSIPAGLLWDSFKYGVMLPTTIAFDTPRYFKYKHIKVLNINYRHFIFKYKNKYYDSLFFTLDFITGKNTTNLSYSSKFSVYLSIII